LRRPALDRARRAGVGVLRGKRDDADPDRREVAGRRAAMSRIKRGWQLTKKSWGLLRENPELLRFPLYGGAATIVCAIVVVGPGVYLIESDQAVLGGAVAVVGFYLLAPGGTSL